MPDTVTHRIEVAPRPSPLIEVSMANADEFLCDGDFGLSVGEGHFPARVIQKITGSPYVHVIGIRKVLDLWYLIESAPPRVRVRRLAELVSEESGLYDVYRLAPDLCDLDKAWDWALRAEDTPYSWRALYRVWKDRYHAAVARGEIEPFDFAREVIRSTRNPAIIAAVSACESEPTAARGPRPNGTYPGEVENDCSSFWREAARVNWKGPPEKLIAAKYPLDYLCVPGDFSIGTKYICTLV